MKLDKNSWLMFFALMIFVCLTIIFVYPGMVSGVLSWLLAICLYGSLIGIFVILFMIFIYPRK